MRTGRSSRINFFFQRGVHHLFDNLVAVVARQAGKRLPAEDGALEDPRGGGRAELTSLPPRCESADHGAPAVLDY